MGTFVQQGEVPRIQLDKRQPRSRYKLDCPFCGKRKCYTPYIDVTTGQLLEFKFGICDHINSCGHNESPKDQFKNDMYISSNKVKKEFVQVQHEVDNCMDPAKVFNSMGNYEMNNFAKFLFAYFPANLVYEVLIRYKVGTTMFPWKNSTIFWQIDKNGVVRSGKVMNYTLKYDETRTKIIDVKRTKHDNGDALISWMHTIPRGGGDYSLKQCLFGEHLINNNIREYHIVEGEKTAIICALSSPEKIFLASGSIMNIQDNKFESLRGCKIILHPDKGKGFTEWSKRAKQELSQYNVTISDYLEKKDTVTDGEDIADEIIRKLINR